MTRRRSFTRIELLVVIAIIMIVLACVGFSPPFEIIGRLVIGWALHLIRLAKEMIFDGDATLVAAIALGLFVVGLHWLAQRWRGGSRTSESRKPWSWRLTLGLAGLIICVALAGIAAVGIAHQSVWLAAAPNWLESGSLRRAAARTQSQNNLKQIALAAMNYHDRMKQLPAGATFDPQGRPLHSWATLLLPYVEQDKLFERIRLDRPWTDAQNQDVFATYVLIYVNPAAAETKIGLLAPCHYAANVHVLGATVRRLSDITDGPSNTILFGEAASQFKAWGQPLNWRDPALGINTTPHGFGNPMLPGASFAFADGSVRFLRENISAEVLKALATPAGGEKIEPREWE